MGECIIAPHASQGLILTMHFQDPNKKHSVVHFTQSFYFRGHLCISTELLGMNLYEYSYNYFSSPSIPASRLGGNKTLWASVPFVTFVLVVALFIRHCYLWLKGAP